MLGACHARVRKEGGIRLAELLGEERLARLGTEYIGVEGTFKTLGRLVEELIDPQNQGYDGVFLRVYEEIVTWDSDNPSQIMIGILASALKTGGYTLTEEELKLRHSNYMRRPEVQGEIVRQCGKTFWSEEMEEKLHEIAEASTFRTWKEISEILGVNEFAAQVHASRIGITKPKSPMDIPGRHETLLEICDVFAKDKISLEEVANLLGLTEADTSYPTRYLSAYCKLYGIKIPNAIGSQSAREKIRIKKLCESRWFDNNAQALRSLYDELRGPESMSSLAARHGKSVGWLKNLIRRHMEVSDSETRETRRMNPPEFDEYLSKTLEKISSIQSEP